MPEPIFLLLAAIIIPGAIYLIHSLSDSYSPPNTNSSSFSPPSTNPPQPDAGPTQNTAVLQNRISVLEKQLKDLQSQPRNVDSVPSDLFSRLPFKPYLKDSPVYNDFFISNQQSLLKNPRVRSALEEQFQIFTPLSVCAHISSSSSPNTVYETTLLTCTCPHFQYRHEPCKHMYRLAIELGLLLNSSDKHRNELMSVASAVRRDQDRAKEELSRLDLLRQEHFQTAPHLAALWADYEELQDRRREDALRAGSHPAPRAADQVKEIRAEKRVLVEENRQLKHQLDFLTSQFPWLEDFMELSVEEVQQAAAAAKEDSDYASEYDSLRSWLSPEEYARLTDVQRYQLALDRYKDRNRSNWSAGIDYERYIGYACEKRGLRVTFNGATSGKEDMGRDLIARSGSKTWIIQCKRLSKSKNRVIHENAVFQLYGSCIQYQLEHPGSKVTGVICTTSELTDLARSCAQAIGIEVYENVPLQNYPMVKCNIGNDGVKRFHLPFFQMYDRLHISFSKGDFYAETVQEAMDAGFVKAKRWTGSNT